LVLDEFRAQGIGFGLWLFAGSSEYENSFTGVNTTPGVLYVTQCCIIVKFIFSIDMEF
jgi:hypothetical protein